MKIAPYIAIVFDGFFTIISLNIFLGYLHPSILESACVLVCLFVGWFYLFIYIFPFHYPFNCFFAFNDF